MSDLVDWDLALRVGRAGAGDGPSASGPELREAASRAEAAVLRYTGLDPVEPIPEAEWVSRRQWVELNLEAMRDLLAPLEGRLGESSGGALTAGPMRAVVGRVMAVELGGLLALASRRVLGQYEFPLLGGSREPRLLFVGANIDSAAEQLGGERGEVLDWVAAHEVTHAVHFAAAPWLRDHVGGLARSLLDATELRVSLSELLEATRRIASSDPRSTISRLRESDPLTLLAPAGSRETIAEMQATMAAIEGYAEHVMDAAGSPAEVERLRAGMERRRAGRGPLARLLAWLLGFELKLRQYRDGKRFADEVVGQAGIAGLNRAWSAPATLPSLPELGRADLWLARVEAEATVT